MLEKLGKNLIQYFFSDIFPPHASQQDYFIKKISTRKVIKYELHKIQKINLFYRLYLIKFFRPNFFLLCDFVGNRVSFLMLTYPMHLRFSQFEDGWVF